MLTQEQIWQIEYSFKHTSTLVFEIENVGVFIADRTVKRAHDGTIEMKECYEVDESCFTKSGDYYGDVTRCVRKLILQDPYAGNPNIVASCYKQSEIKELR